MIVEIALAAGIGIFIYGTTAFIRDKIFYPRLPPGPTPLPFIGTVYRLDKNVKPWRSYKKLKEEYGDIFTVYLGQLRIIVINGLENIREAFVQNSKHFSDRADTFIPGFSSTFPQGITRSDGEQWNVTRRYGVTGLRKFGVGRNPVMLKIQDEANHLIRTLESRCDGRIESELGEHIQNNVFNVLCSLVYGSRFDMDDPDFWAIRDTGRTFFERPFEENAMHMFFPFLRWFTLPPQAKDINNICKEVERVSIQVIKERQNLPKREDIEDYIDLYLQNPHQMTWDTFVATAVDLLLAGTETTASLLTWGILYMCKWPHFQVKCQEAIDEVISNDRMPTAEDRKSLTYIDAVLCELHRHVTLAPTSIPHGVKNYNVELNGFQIPHHTLIQYNIWGLHNDEEYWKDPETFRPERWLDDEGKLIDHSSHFMPFGTGPRTCMGDGLAKVEYYVFLTAMLQRFNFKFPSEDYDVDVDSGLYNLTHVPPPFDCVLSLRHN